MTEGLKLDFNTKPPPSYEEPNNKTARENIANLADLISKWEKEEACVEVTHSPDWVSPLSVKIEYDNFGTITKKRPCIDLSRYKINSNNFHSLNIIYIYIIRSH